MTKTYTDADVELAAAALCPQRADLALADARAVLDALAAAGRLAHDCERRPCPFEGMWNDSDPKPDDALARLQAAFNDVVTELAEVRAEAKGARDDYEQLKAVNAELADERDGLKRLLAQVRRDEAASRLSIQP